MAVSKKKEKNSWITSGLDFKGTTESTNEHQDESGNMSAVKEKNITANSIKEPATETPKETVKDSSITETSIHATQSSSTSEQDIVKPVEPFNGTNVEESSSSKPQEAAPVQSIPSFDPVSGASSSEPAPHYSESDSLPFQMYRKPGPVNYAERVKMMQAYAEENQMTKEGIDYMSPMQNVVLNSGVIQQFSQTWMREPRSIKISCSITPTLHRKIEKERVLLNIKSRNDLVNFLLEQYFAEREKMILMQNNNEK